MTYTKQKPKGISFKVQFIAISNPFYTDLIHQCGGGSVINGATPYSLGTEKFVSSVD